MTYVVGSEASDVFYNAKGADVSAEAAYAALTVPVFGEGVLYGVSHEVMTEQKKFVILLLLLLSSSKETQDQRSK